MLKDPWASKSKKSLRSVIMSASDKGSNTKDQSAIKNDILDSDSKFNLENIENTKSVSVKPEIFKEFVIDSELNTKFNGLDIDEFFQFVSNQVEATGDDLKDKQEEILDMVDFMSRY